MSSYQIDQELDVCGLNCPLPLLKAKQALSGMDVGKVLKVTATDAGSQRDFVAYIDQVSHELLSQVVVGDKYIYVIRRG